MVICSYQRQIESLKERLATMPWIEIDMSYKRLRGRNEREIVWAAWDPKIRQGMSITSTVLVLYQNISAYNII
jgi:hypothetical protein